MRFFTPCIYIYIYIPLLVCKIFNLRCHVNGTYYPSLNVGDFPLQTHFYHLLNLLTRYIYISNNLFITRRGGDVGFAVVKISFTD